MTAKRTQCNQTVKLRFKPYLQGDKIAEEGLNRIKLLEKEKTKLRFVIILFFKRVEIRPNWNSNQNRLSAKAALNHNY